MKEMKRNRTIQIVTLAVLFLGGAALVHAQANQPDEPAKPKANKQTDTATKNAEDQPKWDPLRAEKDLEGGRKTDAVKVKMAARLRAESVVTLDWIAQRLRMGCRHTVANCLKK